MATAYHPTPTKSAYTEGMKRQLHEMGLGWFAQNPCMSFKEMKRFLDMGVPRDFLQERLDDAKCSIEDTVRRFTLDQKLVTHTDGQFSPERRCVLLGKVGQGKSSLGNLLLGNDEFKVYDTVRSGTQESKYAFSQTHNVHVFDTQGFKDSEGRDVDLDMPKIFDQYCEGIHAFIFVLSMSNPRITNEDIEVIVDLQQRFGREVLDYAFIVLTHAGTYFEKNKDKSLRDYLREMRETPLADALHVVGDRVIAVENSGVGYQIDLTRNAVLSHINEHVARSTKGCYTNRLMKEILAKQQRQWWEEDRGHDNVSLFGDIGQRVTRVCRVREEEAEERRRAVQRFPLPTSVGRLSDQFTTLTLEIQPPTYTTHTIVMGSPFGTQVYECRVQQPGRVRRVYFR